MDMYNFLLNKILFLFLFLFLFGCTGSNHSFKNNMSDDAGLYKVVTTKNIISTLNNNKSKYKILYFDLLSPADNNKRKIIIDFSKSLGQYAILGDFNDEKLQKKKIYFQKIQKIFGSSYEFYHSPFMVFLKSDHKNNYSIVDILSFSSMPEKCMKEQLDRIEARIYLGENQKDIINNLNKLKITACRLTSLSYVEVEQLLKLLKIIISG